MRSKEQAHDYRYFPNLICCRWLWMRTGRKSIRKSLPEFPERVGSAWSGLWITEYDARVLTGHKVAGQSV